MITVCSTTYALGRNLAGSPFGCAIFFVLQTLPTRFGHDPESHDISLFQPHRNITPGYEGDEGETGGDCPS